MLEEMSSMLGREMDVEKTNQIISVNSQLFHAFYNVG